MDDLELRFQRTIENRVEIERKFDLNAVKSSTKRILEQRVENELIRLKSESYSFGVRQYDVILAINGDPVRSLNDAEQTLSNQSSLKLELLRNPTIHQPHPITPTQQSHNTTKLPVPKPPQRKNPKKSEETQLSDHPIKNCHKIASNRVTTFSGRQAEHPESHILERVATVDLSRKFIKSQQSLAAAEVKLTNFRFRTAFEAKVSPFLSPCFEVQVRKRPVTGSETRTFPISWRCRTHARLVVSNLTISADFTGTTWNEAVTRNMNLERHASMTLNPFYLSEEQDKSLAKRAAANKLANELKQAGKFVQQQKHVDEVLEKRKQYFDEAQASTAWKESSAVKLQKDRKTVSKCIMQELIASEKSKGSRMFRLKKQLSQESEETSPTQESLPEPVRNYSPPKVVFENMEHVYSKGYKKRHSLEPEPPVEPWDLRELVAQQDTPSYHPSTSLYQPPTMAPPTDDVRSPMPWSEYRTRSWASEDRRSPGRSPVPPQYSFRSFYM